MRTKPFVAEAAVVKNTNDELRATNSPNQNDKEPKNSDEHTALNLPYFGLGTVLGDQVGIQSRVFYSYGRRTLANI